MTSFSLEIPTDRLLRSLRAATLMTSTDKTRSHLNSVQLRVRPLTEGGCALCATDGHLAAIIKLPECGARTGYGEALLALDDVERLVKQLPAKSSKFTVITVEGDAVTVTTSGSSATIGFKAVDATYPPLDQVLPAQVFSEIAPPMLSTALHRTITQAVNALSTGKKDVGLRLLATSSDPKERETSPIIAFAPGTPELLVVAMPVRDGLVMPDLASFRALVAPRAKKAVVKAA